MMKKKKSHPAKVLFALTAIPAIIVFFSAFSVPEYRYIQPEIAFEPLLNNSAIQIVGHNNEKKNISDTSLVITGYKEKIIEDNTGSSKPKRKLTLSASNGGAAIKTSEEKPENKTGAPPLFILDGVQTDTRLQQINPNDIHSISVLKNEAATALYGEKGKNGVIIVTTKQIAPDQETPFVTNATSHVSISKQETPLIIIDGKITDKNMNEIKPEDILSISVLKDKTATDLYNTDGKNGVIIITTKKSSIVN